MTKSERKAARLASEKRKREKRRERERERREQFLRRESETHPERLAAMTRKKKRGYVLIATGQALGLASLADGAGEGSTGITLAYSGLTAAGIVLLSQHYS